MPYCFKRWYNFLSLWFGVGIVRVGLFCYGEYLGKYFVIVALVVVVRV